ncbi:hypothetical protein GCM10025865_04350 [Paraoerskovia sediminicola]|uniref:Acetate kinase n=1 Tax=Paraoerskovia sediminicola TaxID=1138587 RepID=A0ABN6X8U7_9CELL|nr:hypothetical protein GCM10025865_04350 [Paraoerskovia sediminicola]
MLGLCGESDFRLVHDLIAKGDEDARIALDVYLHRLKKYIGGYTAVLGGLDVITFTAGIGENDDAVRAGALDGLEHLGIKLDPELNAGRVKEPKIVSTDDSPVTVVVYPTNEELAIARHTMRTAGLD